jgi:Ca2+-binding RTX toxin-like protein
VPRALVLLIVALGFAAVPDAALGVIIERQGATLSATGSNAAEGFGVTVWNTESGPMYAFVPNTSASGPHGTVLEPDSGCSEPASDVEVVLCGMDGVTSVAIDAGTGDDWLTVSGTPVPVTVHAGGGDDVLLSSGASAQVTLLGDDGNDAFNLRGNPVTADGGAGDDLLDARAGIGADTIVCGSGIDSIQRDAGDSVAADCEGGPATVVRLMNARALATAASPLKRERLKALISGGLPLVVTPTSAGNLTARLSTTTSAGKRTVIAKAAKSGGSIKVTLRLTKGGKALARKTSRLKVRLVLRLATPGRATVTYAVDVTLR